MTPMIMTTQLTAKLRLCVMLLLPVVLFSACAQEQEQEEIVRPVRAIKIGDASAFFDRRFPGRAKAHNEVNIAFEVPGRLVQRPVNVGDQVKAGKLLAALDPRDFENALAQAKAAREQALAYRDRIAIAVRTGAVSRQDLTDAQARFDATDAEVKIRQKALEDSVIHAPFDGTVAAIYVENYENILAKEVIMRVLDTSKIEMIVDVPEGMIADARYVTETWVAFDAIPKREFTAKITEISNEASPTTRTYPVTVIVEQPEDVEILPGMAGKAWGKVERPGQAEAPVAIVPMSAVFSDEAGQKSYVWVIDEQSNTVSRREVTLGELSEYGMSIQKGLQTDEWVVVAGVSYLREGRKVNIVPAEAGGTGQAVKLPHGLGAKAGERTRKVTGGRE